MISSPTTLLRQVENLHDFAGMLVFDKWTCNTNGRQTLFIGEQAAAVDSAEAGKQSESSYFAYRTLMIDQGFCFSAGDWKFPDAPLRGLYARQPGL